MPFVQVEATAENALRDESAKESTRETKNRCFAPLETEEKEVVFTIIILVQYACMIFVRLARRYALLRPTGMENIF
jgi:hypothetical protein